MKQQIFIILIGGCSRSGKSSLAMKLKEQFLKSGNELVLLNLDSWIIDLEKRKPESKVIERFQINEIVRSVNNLLKGEVIHHPVYNPILRKNQGFSSPIQIKSGILIIEGVVALAIPELLKIASLKIFVDVSNITRLKRLVFFYKEVKKVEQKEYRKIILEREKEEVPFIKASKKEADIIY